MFAIIARGEALICTSGGRCRRSLPSVASGHVSILSGMLLVVESFVFAKPRRFPPGRISLVSVIQSQSDPKSPRSRHRLALLQAQMAEPRLAPFAQAM